MTVSLIYKIVGADAWSAASAAGRFEGAPVDLKDGYIHFSTAAQVREPLRGDTARTAAYGPLLDPLRTALGLPPA